MNAKLTQNNASHLQFKGPVIGTREGKISLRKAHGFLVLILPIIILIAGCNANGNETLAVPAGAQANMLTEMEPCEYHPKDSTTAYPAECGTLVVPENREDQDPRLIALPVVRIPSNSRQPAEAVFYLQGGPGQSNLSWAPPAWLTKDYDLVFVGYRGIDGSVALSCPGVSRAIKRYVGKDLFGEAARSETATAVSECAESFEAAGVDLTGYTIPEVIEDMEAARSALGYERINLLSESYGTRVAQLYAYQHPASLNRLVLIGVNPPGHFVWDTTTIDELIRHASGVCSNDPGCSSRTDNLAETMKDVSHNMPNRWLIFNIDPDTVRLGANFMFLNNQDMALIFDIFLAAAEGDPSGLAMLNLMTMLAPIDQQLMGDLLNKAGSVDLEKYLAIQDANLDDSIMGAPMTEYIWPMATAWPIELIPENLRDFQQSDVEMLLVNGTLDFSTPPASLKETLPFYTNAQIVLLSDFGHINDVMTLQPEAFERLVISYYDTGVGDASLFVHQPLSFIPPVRLTVAAKVVIAVLAIVTGLILVFAVVGFIRKRRRKSDVMLDAL